MSEESTPAPEPLNGHEIAFDQPGGIPTPEQVGRVWNALANPTVRSVADKMTQIGWKISFKTVSRYQRAGFISSPLARAAGKVAGSEIFSNKVREKQRSQKQVRAKVAKATEQIAKTPPLKDSPEMAAVRVALDEARKPDEMVGDDFEKLMQKSTLELKEQFSKTTMVAGIMLAEAVIRRREALSLLPKEVGCFLNDMSQVADNLKLTGDDMPAAPRESNLPRLIDVTPAHADGGPQTSELSSKITQFMRAREKATA